MAMSMSMSVIYDGILMEQKTRGRGTGEESQSFCACPAGTTTLVTDDVDLIGNEIYPTGCFQRTFWFFLSIISVY